MKKNTLLFISAIIILLSFSPLTETKVAHSQTAQRVECGDIIEDEFTQDYQEHNYLLEMKAGDSCSASVVPTGDLLSSAVGFYGPTNIRLGVSNGGDISKSPTLETNILSARGDYRIRVANAKIHSVNNIDFDKLRRPRGGVGEYRLLISCIVDGEEIEAGSQSPSPTTPTPMPTPTPRQPVLPDVPEFDGVGFPGLAPVDFSDVARVPLPLGEPMHSVVPLQNGILGFTVDAAAGDVLALDYERVSGDMNLGLVVLSENNQVFFQASLVTAQTLSTQFTLPQAGQYTVGVFRIALVEPADPQPTAIRLRGALNPVPVE